jgi:uncharacterized membrane protein
MTSDKQQKTATPEARAEITGNPDMARVVERNIEALLWQRHQQERQRTTEERIADNVTRFTGSMVFVYIHLIGFGCGSPLIWDGYIQAVRSFVCCLAMFASVEAIFLSTFVLISQNRMAALSDKRADLDLHVSLLAEHEITHLIRLVAKMAEKMGIDTSLDQELPQQAQDVLPENVILGNERAREQLSTQHKTQKAEN